jgi:hypothetical protein
LHVWGSNLLGTDILQRYNILRGLALVEVLFAAVYAQLASGEQHEVSWRELRRQASEHRHLSDKVRL